jgi:N-acetylglucosaminyldiphosphoundecaprenol N-acetyl-beta-D-mannosaminyltransferase
MGPLPIDSLTLEEALDVVQDLVDGGEGGSVFTPNVDHVVLADMDARLRGAYARASLSLVDGAPLVWASRLLGETLPEKISGSDFVLPLLERASEREWRVYFLGGAPGVGEKARDKLCVRLPRLQVVGVDSPRIDVDDSPERREAVLAPIRDANPQLVLVALGAPKQEIWIDRARDALRPAVLLGIGAALDFVAGTVPRAPAWLSRVGLEWLFRLSREPRRLWRRYLVRDPRFVLLLARAIRERRRVASRAR